jgi:CHAT domain-containing protein/Tfp pilus assembly protein PilF
MMLGWSILVAAVAAGQSSGADSLRVMAIRLPERALVLEVRARPHDVRDAYTEAVARSAGGDTLALTAARQLASAYAIAWQDSFLVQDVRRFTAWPAARRAARVWVDSTRKAGITAYGRDGPRAAIRTWRRALRRAMTNDDSVATAMVLGNIGAALWREGSLDSADLYLDRARATAVAVGDRRTEANALGALGNVSADRGARAVAREHYLRALDLRERIGDRRGVAADHNNLGLLAQEAGELDEARRRFEMALALHREDGRHSTAAINLVNLAGLASLTGDFGRAETLYRDALTVWRSEEMWVETVDALRGLADLEVRRGDYAAAREALGEALTILERTGPEQDAIIVRSDRAAVLAALGDLQGAIDALRSAEQHAAGAPAATRAHLALTRADILTQLNAFEDADRQYRRAAALYREARDTDGEAEAQHGRGMLLIEREDYVTAQHTLEVALRTHVSSGNARSAALTRLALGAVALRRGAAPAARRHMARAANELERLGDPVATAAAIGEQARVEAELGRPAAAESLFQRALTHLDDVVAPEVAWRLRSGLAMAKRARGAVDGAAREFRAAIAAIDQPSRSLRLAQRRSGFLADKWEVYAQMALTERSRGRTASAFETSERMRAREMLELLARGRVTVSSDTPEDLAEREQDLRRRLAELSHGMERSSGDEDVRGPDVSRTDSRTRDALLRAQDAYAELLVEIGERAPRHAALVTPRIASWRDVARRLQPDEALVEYLVSDSSAVAFVVRRDTLAAVALDHGRRDLARLVEFARGTLEPSASRRGDSLWRAPMRRLHEALIRPLEDAVRLGDATRLIIVPHLELHYLPFAALLAPNGQFLADAYEVIVTPSASVWLALGEREGRASSSAILAFAPKPDALPASSREVNAIARPMGGGVRAVIGSAATEDAFRHDAASHRILHLATYGVLNKHNPLFSFVELAPGPTHDGRLEVHEVLGMSLTADLVVLSACQTALASGTIADVPSGDDWVGLTRAFLHAGAERVVATLWAVDDWATAAFMEFFYESYGVSHEPISALAHAQRSMRLQRATAHPFFWAGFVVVGGAEKSRTPARASQ